MVKLSVDVKLCPVCCSVLNELTHCDLTINICSVCYWSKLTSCKQKRNSMAKLPIDAGFCPECYSLVETSVHHDFVVKMCTECNWYQVFRYRPETSDGNDFELTLTEKEWKLIYDRLKGSCDPIARALTNKIAFHVLGIYRC